MIYLLLIVHCRRRKLKCDRLRPCTNCKNRDCVYLTGPWPSASQQKRNELARTTSSLEEAEISAQQSRSDANSQRLQHNSFDPFGDATSSSSDDTGPLENPGLEPTLMATTNAAHEDDANDDVLDLGIRIGKMRMTERLGGFFRPKLTEEVAYTLRDQESDRRTDEEKLTGMPQLLDYAQDFLEPGPSYIPLGAGFIFGVSAPKVDLTKVLPRRDVTNLLMNSYYQNVHLIARVVHWPSFCVHYDNFWNSILADTEQSSSQQALILAVMFSAIASLSQSEIAANFGQPKQVVLANFQRATEAALVQANFLRTTKLQTMQALVIYLIPMCRDQMSRAHSVLVGAAARLGECMGLHRDPSDVYGLSPVECQVKRTLWYQLCFLDFRTGDTHGPRPCIRREDYSTKLPLNVNDADLVSGNFGNISACFTDATVSIIRFECTEMQRTLWYDRQRIEEKKTSLTHVMGKIESFRKSMEAKYSTMLDKTVPIQHYALCCLRLLLMRMHIMILHRYLHNASNKVPQRLRQIIVSSGTALIEAAHELETTPLLTKWRWYNGAHQQWHTALLLLTEVYAHPNIKEADRIWRVLDFVFEPDPTLSRVQKARTIMNAIGDRTATYRDLRRMRNPISMRSDDVQRMYVSNYRDGQDVLGVSEAGQTTFTTLHYTSDSAAITSSTVARTMSNESQQQSVYASNPPWAMEYPQSMFSGKENSAQIMNYLTGWSEQVHTSSGPPTNQNQMNHQDLAFDNSVNAGASEAFWTSFNGKSQEQQHAIQNTTFPNTMWPVNPPVNETVAVNTSILPSIPNPMNANIKSTPETSPSGDSPMLDIDWVSYNAPFALSFILFSSKQ